MKNFTHPIFPSRICGRHISLLLLLFIVWHSSNGQQIAFPGAEGAGRFASGGRGIAATPTTVFEVTNLNDDNNPGSLRYAVTQTATYRTIVFRVSGTIHLSTKLTIKANTTIAGQTAPGDGICLADRPVVINGDNVIVRYIRFRMGDRNQNLGMVDGSGSDDSFGNLGNKNIIIDHCTSGWSSDEALTIYRGDSLTIQWSFITEPLNYSYHFETGDADFEQHAYGGIWGGRHASFHHNLIAHVKGRAPRFDGSRNLSPFTAGQENADFRNNVLYNWEAYNVNGGEGGNYNIVNNYYKYGPSTSTGSSTGVPIKYMVINPGKQTSAPVLPYGQYYVTGNYVDGSAAITQNNWLGAAMSGGTQADTTQSKVTVPFTAEPVTTQSAQDAYGLVLQYGGASFARDTLDQRIVNDVINRTGRIIDVQGGYPHGTPYANTVNAWPVLNSTTAPVDTDHDGMPDTYETINGLNPNDPSDRAGIAGNGYTNLENYIDGIVNAATIATTGSLHAFAQNIPLVSPLQNYIVSGTELTADITITPPANFQVSDDNGTTWHGNSNPLTVVQTGGTVAPKTIAVRLNASTAGNYSGTILNASTGAVTSNVPVSGTAYATSAPPGTALVVAQDGSGDYTTVQAAINAAPTGRTTPYIIFIKNGRYKEKITVPSNKPFIQLVGESVANVILYYTDGASDPLPGGGTVGTQNSASFTVNANDFSAFNITFANTWGDGTQAVAVLVNADRAVFKNCRMLGNQDTLYIKGSGAPRHYFRDCYIDGNVDFIFGSSVAVFDSTVVYPKSRTTSGSSFITAANTPPGQAYGYIFRDCRIPNNTGATSYYLGRPWQNSTGSSPLANNKVVFLNTMMGTTVAPEGWVTWDAGTNTSLIYYGEYQSKYFNGTAVNTSQRVPWSVQLNATDAATYTNANLFGTWDPCAVSSSVCTSQQKDIAVSNFRGTKGASNSVFDWNISWAMNQISYQLFRSSVRTSGYASVGTITATNDTAINFQMTDVLPVAGTSYYYYLVASKAGYTSHITDTVVISSIPTISTGGTLQAFTQNLGTPSASQNATVSGTNLTGNIILTPPLNYEISSNGGTTWVANPSTITLTATANTVAATTIAIRLNAPAIGTYNDSIALTTTGGDTKYIKMQGTTAVIPVSTSVVLQHWPFTLNNSDSAAIRSTAVTASTPSFNNLNVSNGTTVPVIPAYSPQFGQAFGVTVNGDGSWGTAVGGPGGTLRRVFYEQFTVTAAAGHKVRVDSIYITGAFYNTSSNTRLAVVYSLSGFVNDSADVFTIPGGFANAASLLNQTAGPSTQFPLSVAGLPGITLQSGQTISFRLYFSCGSTSAGRYAMLKDIKVTGSEILPTPVIVATGTLGNFTQTIGTPSAVQVYSVNADNLTTDITITAPAGYEVSSDGGATWHTNASPLVIPRTGNTVAPTGISVRLNSSTLGAHNGNISQTSTGAIPVNVPVTGITVPVPSISVTGTLIAFSHTTGTPSVAQTYTVSGADLTGNITITPPVNFEVSNDAGATWHTNTSPLVLTPTAGVIAATTISVRMNASAAGTFSGNIIHTSPGAPSVNLAVTGTAIPVPLITTTGTLTAFTQIIGIPSAAQTFTVAGVNLTGNLTVTAPADYELSSNGGTSWSTTPVVLTPAGGTVATTTISVRLNSAVLGTHAGNIANASSGGATKNVAVTGTTVLKPVIVVAQNFGLFTQTVGSSALVQNYTVSGTNLTGNIIITPPAHFQVSIDNGATWQSGPVTLTRVNGAVAPTTVMVRLFVPVTGMFSGVLTHTSSDADAVNVTLNGYNKVKDEYTIYPVPAYRIIFIAHPVTAEKALLTFYSMTGQYITAYSTSPNTIETRIDISWLPMGVYNVEYRLGDKKVKMRFVKQ